MLEVYEALAKELQMDAIVLVDGGTDSLMQGDEEGLGTPMEVRDSHIHSHSHYSHTLTRALAV